MSFSNSSATFPANSTDSGAQPNYNFANYGRLSDAHGAPRAFENPLLPPQGYPTGVAPFPGRLTRTADRHAPLAHPLPASSSPTSVQFTSTSIVGTNSIHHAPSPIPSTDSSVSPSPTTQTKPLVQRRRGNPNQPPRPRNCFLVFRSEFLKANKELRDVEKDHSKLSKIVGQVWRSLSTEKVAEYRVKAQHEKAGHALVHPNYSFKPQPPRKRKQRRTKRNTPEDLQINADLAAVYIKSTEGPVDESALQAIKARMAAQAQAASVSPRSQKDMPFRSPLLDPSVLEPAIPTMPRAPRLRPVEDIPRGNIAPATAIPPSTPYISSFIPYPSAQTLFASSGDAYLESIPFGSANAPFAGPSDLSQLPNLEYPMLDNSDVYGNSADEYGPLSSLLFQDSDGAVYGQAAMPYDTGLYLPGPEAEFSANILQLPFNHQFNQN